MEEQMQNQQAKTLFAFHNYCLVGLATEIDAGSAKKKNLIQLNNKKKKNRKHLIYGEKITLFILYYVHQIGKWLNL